MSIITELNKEHIEKVAKNHPKFGPGDTVKVFVKVVEGTRERLQAFEGVCIARSRNESVEGAFTVRKISFGEGVERVFPFHSQLIDKIEVVRRGKVRRAKLYYLRDRRGKSARIKEKVTIRPPKGTKKAAAAKAPAEKKAPAETKAPAAEAKSKDDA